MSDLSSFDYETATARRQVPPLGQHVMGSVACHLHALTDEDAWRRGVQVIAEVSGMGRIGWYYERPFYNYLSARHLHGRTITEIRKNPKTQDR